MDSYFRKPWIEKLLSTFDPVLVTSLTSEKQESLVCQVMNVKLVTDESDGVAIRGIAEVHDNRLYVKAVFTATAMEHFEEEEDEKGSGVEFNEALKNSIVYMQKYHIIPHMVDDQTKSEFVLCVDGFTLGHYDAFPRQSKYPLILARDKKSIADNMHRLWSRRKESLSSELPGGNNSSMNMSSNVSDSSPHLTQLLEEMNKASEEQEIVRKSCARVFTIKVAHQRGNNSSDDASDLDILCDALNEMERKLAIAKSLHHLLDKKRSDDTQTGVDADGSQLLHDAPAFNVLELPHDAGSKFVMDGFDKSDFDEVPMEVLKQLESIKEWRPDYIKPSSMPSNSSKSCEMMEMRGGGASSSSVEKRDDNKQIIENPPANQEECEFEPMSLGSEWSSIESIGLSTEEIILADSQPDVDNGVLEAAQPIPNPTNPSPLLPDTEQSMCIVEEDTRVDANETGADAEHGTNRIEPAQKQLIKRKRAQTSDGESPSKIPRQKSPKPATSGQRTAAFRESPRKVPRQTSPEPATRGQRTTAFGESPHKIPRAEMTEPVNKEQGTSSPKHPVFKPTVASSPITGCQGNAASVATTNSQLRPSPNRHDKGLIRHSTQIDQDKVQNVSGDGAAWNGNVSDISINLCGNLQDNSDEDIFTEESVVLPPESSQQPDQDRATHPDVPDISGQDKTLASATKKAQSKSVHFDESVGEDENLAPNHDQQGTASCSMSKASEKPSTPLNKSNLSKRTPDKLSHRTRNKLSRFSLNKQQPSREHNASETTDEHDSSVEILNTSIGFETSKFYSSPSPPSVGGKKGRRVFAKLTSPQIPLSLQTPVNSLPSHQPGRSRLYELQPADSQSSVSSSSVAQISVNQRHMDSSMEQLSNIKLEEEVLQWCTGYFIGMVQRRKSTRKKNR